jgi:hypothetical protein
MDSDNVQVIVKGVDGREIMIIAQCWQTVLALKEQMNGLFGASPHLVFYGKELDDSRTLSG